MGLYRKYTRTFGNDSHDYEKGPSSRMVDDIDEKGNAILGEDGKATQHSETLKERDARWAKEDEADKQQEEKWSKVADAAGSMVPKSSPAVMNLSATAPQQLQRTQIQNPFIKG